MGNKKRFFVIILTVSLLLSVCLSAGASPVTVLEGTSVIDAELVKKLDTVAPDDSIPVDIWLYDIETEAVREQNVKSLIGVNRQVLAERDDLSVTSEAVDQYIAMERKLYAEKQTERYASLQKEYNRVKGLQKAKENKRLFFSQYAPLIRTELNPSEIKMLAKDSRVQTIYYSPDLIIEPESDISIPLIRANYTRDTLGCTGSGIRIGMVEADALPNRSLNYFTSANITYDPNVTQTFSEHANMVASIMVARSTTVNGVTYRGIVPDARLYATYYRSGDPADWRVRVEWLLSQGVNVINMSAGFSNQTAGVYGTHERWLDHLAVNHSVHFVKSAGNSGGDITSPGMAYNSITVGSIDDKNTATHSDDDRATLSSFRETGTTTNKPDLMAPGANIRTAAGQGSGTSYAAPHVTAVVAQLCQRKPALKTLQDGMKAILTASINHSRRAYSPANSEYNEYGAGVVDTRSSVYTADNYRFTTGNFAANSANGIEKTFTFNVSSSDTRTRISLSWLKYSVLSGTHAPANATDYPLADLDLYVYDPSGAYVGGSAMGSYNTEIVAFTPTKTGTYKIVVKQYGNSTRAVYFGLAWW